MSAVQLDVLASNARTALDDPAGLPPGELEPFAAAAPFDVIGPAAEVDYAVATLDRIINTLNPSDWTRATAALACRTLGRHLADVMDGLEDRELIPAVIESAITNLDTALDYIDSAIRDLEGDE